jgi:autotransporter-associated beta strand protein
LFAAVNVPAQTTVQTWTGTGATGFFSDQGNWAPTISPPFPDTYKFGLIGPNYNKVLFASAEAAKNIEFLATRDIVYHLTPASGTSTLTLGGDITVAAGLDVVFDYGLNPVLASGEHAFDVAGSTNLQIDGVVSGPGHFTKTGAGTLTLTGTNTYGGGTAINGGTLVAGASSAFGAGGITVTGGKLSVASAVILTNSLTLNAGATLAGTGTFGSSVTVGSNVHLSPGNSPGLMNFSAGLTVMNGGVFDLEVQSASAGAGIGYDTITVSGGALDLSSVSAGGFTLKLISLNLSGGAGAVSDFSNTSAYSWTIFSTAGITQFAANKFALDLAGFSNDLGGGSFSVSQSGNNVLLNFTAVPEPSTYVLLALGLGSAGLAAWRRQRRA